MLRLFKKVKQLFAKTGSILGNRIASLFTHPWDDSVFDTLEQTLYEADLGSEIAADCSLHIKKFLRKHPSSTPKEILQEVRAYAEAILEEPPLVPPPSLSSKPHVILVVGVNGSGKTTSLAKLSHHFQKEGKRVLIGACDTFRAAAVEQLSLWAEKLQIEIVKGKEKGDPSSVVYDTLSKAKAMQADIVLLDTAGRLQNKKDLMEELSKLKRVCAKVVEGSPQETLLVIDGTTGQNALDQVAIFQQFTPLTGVILSKLDSSAKGGSALCLYKKYKIPIRWIGVGESVEDLLPFEAKEYTLSLFEDSSKEAY